MKHLVWILCMLLLPGVLSAQSHSRADSSAAFSHLLQRHEVYFRFPEKAVDNEVLKRQLIRILSVDKLDSGYVYAYANQQSFADFLSNKIPYEVLTPPSLRYNVSQENQHLKSTADWNFYPSYPEYLKLMRQFATDYPDLCQLDTIGTSVDGRLLLSVNIHSNKDSSQARPQFLYTASIHGDETVGYVLMLHLIDYLLKNYGQEPLVTQLVDSLDIWINPLANPDGTYASGDLSVSGATRFNADSVDLNRNYPDPAAGDHPDGKGWQPETEAFMNFAQAHHFVMSANLHGGSELVNYPWDTWSRLTADNDWWQYVSRQYADTVHAHSVSGYFIDMNDGITDGYAWYRITGGRQDYVNYFHHDRECTVELSHIKMPDPSELPVYWDYNYKSLLHYMRQALFSIRGKVTDSLTGKPVYAKVYINDYDKDHSEVYADSVTGMYFRPVKGGTYSVTFSAPGYVSKTYLDLSTNDGSVTVQHVILQPRTDAIHNPEDKVKIGIYPNPARSFVTLKGISGAVVVSLFSLNGRKLYTRTLSINNRIKVSDLPRGTYILEIRHNHQRYTHKLLLY